MLSSLLPGLRELRAPLAAGALWLVALWFLFEPAWDRRADGDGFTASANRLVSALDLFGQGAALAFTAYLVGSVSVLLFSRALTSRFRTSLEPSGRLLDGLSDLARVSLAQVAVDGRKRLEQALGASGTTVDQVLGLVAPVPGPLVGVRSARRDRRRTGLLTLAAGTSFPPPAQRQEREIAERVLRDLPVVATAQLLGREPEVFAAVDRSQAEVEFRVALVPAVLGLAATTSSALWSSRPSGALVAVALGVLGAVGLVLDAARRRRDANEMVLSLMEHGRITAPSVLRAESEAAARADQSPAAVVERQRAQVARAVQDYLDSLEAVPSSGTFPMLQQAHAAAAAARTEARELDRLLDLHGAVPPGSPPTTSVLEPVDRALAGWTALNEGVSGHLEEPAVAWGSDDPAPDQLLDLLDEGRRRWEAMLERVRRASAALAEREVPPGRREA